MLKRLIESRKERDEGFTLIELMVVVLIIAILIAIAIPTFLGARERAQNRAAQSDLRNALTAAKTFYTDTENYNVTVPAMDAIEPSLNYDAAIANADADTVGFTAGATTVDFATASASGDFFAICEDAEGGTEYGVGAGAAAAVAACGPNGW